MKLSRVAGIGIGLFALYVLGKWFFTNPEKAANAVNSGADSAKQGGDHIATFLSSLTAPGLLFLAIVIGAIVIARRGK